MNMTTGICSVIREGVTPVHAPLSALIHGPQPERLVVRATGSANHSAAVPSKPATESSLPPPMSLPQMIARSSSVVTVPRPTHVARAAIAPSISPMGTPPISRPAIAPAVPSAPAAPAVATTAVVEAPAASAAPYAMGGLAIAMIGSIGFSGKAIIVKVAYRYGVDAVTLIMYRMLVALVPFLLIAWWAGRGKPPLSWRDRGSIFILGLTGYYLASFLDFLGLQYISASLERLILYLNPTLVFLFGLLFFKQRATRKQVIAVATGYAGMLVVFGGEISFSGSNVPLGTSLVFAGAVSYALYISYSGALVSRLGSLRLVGWASTVACLLCFAQFLILRPLSAAIVPAPVLWLSLINGTLCTVMPVLLLMIAISRVGAASAAHASLLGPISTIAMSVFILDEPFTAWVAAGTTLVIGSIWMLARKPASSAHHRSKSARN
jgi:drug/metabolite transporter (DMT)-like permease